MKKRRKSTRAALIRKADALFSIRVRAIGRCVSGRDKHAGSLQCAHGFSRRYMGTRWDEENAFCLCAGCHVYYTYRPLEWDEWLRATMADYWGVRARALAITKADPSAAIERICKRT